MASLGSREQLVANCRWLFNKDVQLITFVTTTNSTPSEHLYIAAVLEKDCNLELVAGSDHQLAQNSPRGSKLEEKLIVKAFSLFSTAEAVNLLGGAIEEEIGAFLKGSRDGDTWGLRLTDSTVLLGDLQMRSLCDRVHLSCARKVSAVDTRPGLPEEIATLKKEIAELRKSNSDNYKPAPLPPLVQLHTSEPSVVGARCKTPSASTTIMPPAEVENTSSEPTIMQAWNKLKSIHEQHEWLFNQRLLGDKRMERYVRQDLIELASSISAYLGEEAPDNV